MYKHDSTTSSQKEIEEFVAEARKLSPTLSIKGGFNLTKRGILYEKPKISGNKNFQIIDQDVFNLRAPSLILVESREGDLIYVEEGSTLGMNTSHAWELFDMSPTKSVPTFPYDSLGLCHRYATPIINSHARDRNNHRYFVRAVGLNQVKEILIKIDTKISGLLIFEHDDVGLIRALARLISSRLCVPTKNKLTIHEQKRLSQTFKD